MLNINEVIFDTAKKMIDEYLSKGIFVIEEQKYNSREKKLIIGLLLFLISGFIISVNYLFGDYIIAIIIVLVLSLVVYLIKKRIPDKKIILDGSRLILNNKINYDLRKIKEIEQRIKIVHSQYRGSSRWLVINSETSHEVTGFCQHDIDALVLFLKYKISSQLEEFRKISYNEWISDAV